MYNSLKCYFTKRLYARQRFRDWLIFPLLLLANIHANAQQTVLTLNTALRAPYCNSSHTGYADLIAFRAFRKIGYQLRLVEQPPERALKNANAGNIDGELLRIAGLSARYPNLIRVPVALVNWEFTAFHKTSMQDESWLVLRNQGIGLIRGWKLYETMTIGAPFVTKANNPEQLFKILELGRIRVALYERWQGLALLKARGIRDIAPLPYNLEQRDMFIYLNRRYAALIPQLTTELRKLKSSGYFKLAYSRTLLPIRSTHTP